MGALTARLNSDNKVSNDIEARIAAKLATGKFTDTGAKYSAEQAVADASNDKLRMTARTDENNRLYWAKD